MSIRCDDIRLVEKDYISCLGMPDRHAACAGGRKASPGHDKSPSGVLRKVSKCQRKSDFETGMKVGDSLTSKAEICYPHCSVPEEAVVRCGPCRGSGRLRVSRKATRSSSSPGLSEGPKAGILVPPLTIRMTRLSCVSLSAM